MALTWPLVIRLGAEVPGAARSDLWNSMWTLWYAAGALAQGQLPWRTTLLGWPGGGIILPSDPLNALLAAPLTLTLGVATTYGLLALAHLVFSGVAAHLLARDVQGSDRAGWVAGAAWMCAPVMISALHNGTSEALAGGWLALAVREILRCGRGGRWLRCGLSLALATAGSWYMGVCGWLVLVAALAVGRAGVPWWVSARRLAAAGALALALTAPLAVVTSAAATAPDNLVGIKHHKELDAVRRSTGAADPRGWFMPGDWRSPDFRRISAYGEEFIHCHYLGWSLLILAGFTRRSRRAGALGLAALGGFALAHGPVVVLDAGPWILDGRLAVPMPYFLVEDLPGFSSLSLLFRLAALPSLALAVLAGGAATRGPRWVPAVLAVVVLVELRLIAPVAGLPDHQSAAVSPAIQAIAEGGEGAVMNAPLAGGRAYLYEQTVHGRPVAGTLNFPASTGAQSVWRVLIDGASRRLPPEALLRRASGMARSLGIRYLVVHEDPIARPGQHEEAVRALRAARAPVERADGVEVYDLWLD